MNFIFIREIYTSLSIGFIRIQYDNSTAFFNVKIRSPVCDERERFEYFEDGFLNLISAVHVFLNFTDHNDHQRGFCYTTIFISANYRALGFKSRNHYYNTVNAFSIGGKLLADAMEAILEAALLSSEEKLGIKCILRGHIIARSDIVKLTTLLRFDVSYVQSIIGYEFTLPVLLIEAFECIDNTIFVLSQKQLEYSGGKVLYCSVLSCIFHDFPIQQSGGLTEIRGHLVKNDGVSLSIMVTSGLHNFTIFKDNITIDRSRDSDVSLQLLNSALASLLGASIYDNPFESKCTHSRSSTSSLSVYGKKRVHIISSKRRENQQDIKNDAVIALIDKINTRELLLGHLYTYSQGDFI
ncbi:hypothetical protein K502DRAFT_365015 [Neoconidiobolus thromboides FSU 785]|nr:hypothetical protein K502DRAFT_365015 [Neoconidiobolus thromboides FSU 785]